VAFDINILQSPAYEGTQGGAAIVAGAAASTTAAVTAAVIAPTAINLRY
jgi:hypothetical protein